MVNPYSSTSSTEPDIWYLYLELLTLKPEMLCLYSKKTKQNLPICKEILNFYVTVKM